MQPERPIHALLAGRRSPRAFDPDREVAREDLETILEAARWSPSCFNEQPWRYIVCERGASRDAWDALLGCLVEGNQRWARRAPVLIAALARVKEGATALLPFYDTGAASLSLSLQAAAMGLIAHQMGGFDVESVRRAFEVPAEFQPLAVIALGYPGDPLLLDEKTRARETAPRQRRSVREFAVFGRGAIPS